MGSLHPTLWLDPRCGHILRNVPSSFSCQALTWCLRGARQQGRVGTGEQSEVPNGQLGREPYPSGAKGDSEACSNGQVRILRRLSPATCSQHQLSRVGSYPKKRQGAAVFLFPVYLAQSDSKA